MVSPRLAFLLLLALAAPALGQNASVGLYRDTNGTACSFSNPGPGLVTAYVVFRPDARGFRAVRFSAPMPACFSAVWIQDLPAEQTSFTGDSQNGITVASESCQSAPTHILTIQYYQTGSIAACCPFPALADPSVQMIEATGCNQESFAASGSTAFLNANETCLCSANLPPAAPSNPTPVDGQANVSVFSGLAWSATDPDNNLASFDLYLGTNPDPPLHTAALTQPSFQPVSPLAELTTFFWKVVARDEAGVETAGPVWSFTTRLTNSPPDAPQDPTPASGTTGFGLLISLSWACGDVDHDPLRYDVYLGTSMTPPLLLTGLFIPQYSESPWDASLLTWNTVYYWRVVARDSHGNETSGPLWTFRTRSQNGPPLPVLFTRFGATAGDEGIRVFWNLQSDEGRARLTLYRRTGDIMPPSVMASGELNTLEGEYIDRTVESATTYRYELMIRTDDGDEFRSPLATATSLARTLVLHQNVPNPFNPQTTIQYELPSRMHVRLSIVDPSGRMVRRLVDETQAAGMHETPWDGIGEDGSLVASGVYFYVLDAGKQRLTRKLVLLK